MWLDHLLCILFRSETELWNWTLDRTCHESDTDTIMLHIMVSSNSRNPVEINSFLLIVGGLGLIYFDHRWLHNALEYSKTPQLTACTLASANRCWTCWLPTTWRLHKTSLCNWPEVCLNCRLESKKQEDYISLFSSSFFTPSVPSLNFSDNSPHNTIITIREMV